MTEVLVKWKKLHDSFVLPKPATTGSACLDMIACIDDPITIMPGKWALVSLGCAIQVPVGHELQVRPRSGLALKEGISILNSPGCVDADYRGLVSAIVINHSSEWYVVRPLDKICQVKISPVPKITCELVDELDTTDRGAGGFGSTGMRK